MMLLCVIVFIISSTSSATSAQQSYSCQSSPISCNDIKKYWPDSPSKNYTIVSKEGTMHIYCNMEELLCGSGGWTRLAYLNMSNSTENCPSGFRLYQSGGVRACGRPTSSGASCVSVQFPSKGISYSQVCGRVVGYQFASPDAVNPTIGGLQSHNDINSYYVDGVSITRGSPRQHVWTLMAGFKETIYTGSTDRYFNCPCSQGSIQNSTIQSFIGNDYFCESGNPVAESSWQTILYASDPLWDGKGCDSLEGNCCTSRPSLPWFNKVLNTTTTDYLELRVCAEQDTIDEDVPVSFYELYVK